LTTILQDRLVGCGLCLACGHLRFALALLFTLALMMGFVTRAGAEAPGVPPPGIFYAPIESLEAQIARHSGDPRPQSTQGAFQVLDWLLYYPGVGVGAACGFNLNFSPTNQIKACGPRFTPSVVAEHNTGIQRTLLYGVGDIRWYPSIDQVQVADTTAGLVHVWEIQRDLIFRVQVQGKEDQQYSGFAGNLLPTNVFLTTPLRYTQGYASSSLQKEFGSFFTAIGGSFTGTAYQDIRDNFGNTIDEQFQNGSVATINGRLGYHISPIIYTFIEPSVNEQRYNESRLNSEGYRIVAGIGSGRIGLINGEIYAGFAHQRFEDPAAGSVSVPVFGGKLSWYPTRFLTFTFTADRSFGTSDFTTQSLLSTGPITSITPGLLPGSPTDKMTETFTAIWDFNRYFAFSAGVQNQQQDYLNSSRKDDLLTFSGGVTYKVWRNFGIQVTYNHQHLFTNLAGASFSSDFIGVGGNTKF
jgi:hypothetical protein